MIEIQHLHKRFGDVTAVNGLSFTAPDAAITGMLGANGAGKTTTLGMITGLLAPDSGTVSIGSTTSNGRDRRSLIGALLDHQGLYPRLTARENIAYFGELQGLSGPALGRRVTELVSALGLDEQADRRVEGFSRGERLKVALGRALVHAPQHLVLDEPTNGLDVASAHNAPESFVAAAPPFFGRLCLGLIPLALMGAALQLLVSTRCRSTKEAQSWLMMVVFVPMVAGMGVVFFPGWTDRWWMIAPIVGQQVMIAGGLGGDGVSLLESLTLAGTTAACTIAMLFVGSAGLNQDDVLAD